MMIRKVLPSIVLFLPLVAGAAVPPKVPGMPFSPAVLPVHAAENVPPMPQPPAGVKEGPVLSFKEEWTAANVLPQPRQAAWQELGFIAFIHFGPNTFTGNEWGSGKENPSIFNPSRLDARQWARALKASGARLAILTAKHHDGFCLWPSRFTDHSVRNSPWKGGKGDVVREAAEALRAEGLKLGIYLSPADLNAIHKGVYGRTEKKHRVIPTPVAGWTPRSKFRMEGEWDDYNAYFMNQLFELLTEYGPVHEVWFDGANPKPGTGQEYASEDWYRLIRALAPEAVIQGRGPDARWIGNERGVTRADEWNVMPTSANEVFRDRTERDLGSRSVIKGRRELIWLPGETDVSVRPGWFYHEGENQRLHSLDRCLDMWYGAAGGNGQFLLNIPPTKEGLFHANDVARLEEIGTVLRATFTNNLASGATIRASHGDAATLSKVLLDGDTGTGWKPADWQRTAELTVTLPEARTFNRIQLMEHIRQAGQRVESHAVDAWVDGAWKPLAEGGVIGCRRIHRVETVKTDKVRIRFLGSRVSPSLAEFGLFLEPTRISAPVIERDGSGRVALKASAGAAIHYTLDGSEPTAASPSYASPFDLANGGLVRAISIAPAGTGAITLGKPVATAEFGPLKKAWRVVSVSSQETSGENAPATQAIDDNAGTIWHTEWKKAKTPPPHTLVVDMNATLKLRGFTYLPRQDGPHIGSYAFEVSMDGKDWKRVAKGEFGNIVNNPIQQTVPFAPCSARYFRLTVLSEATGKPFVAVSEIGVLTAP